MYIVMKNGAVRKLDNGVQLAAYLNSGWEIKNGDKAKTEPEAQAEEGQMLGTESQTEQTEPQKEENEQHEPKARSPGRPKKVEVAAG